MTRTALTLALVLALVLNGGTRPVKLDTDGGDAAELQA